MNVMVGFMAEFNARFSWNPPYSSYEAVCWVIWFIFMLEYPLIFSCWNTPPYFYAGILRHIFVPEYSLIFSSASSVGMAAYRKCKVWSQRLYNKDFQFVVTLDLSRLARVDLNKKMLQTTPYCFCYEFFEGESQRSHIGGKVTLSSRRHNHTISRKGAAFAYLFSNFKNEGKS